MSLAKSVFKNTSYLLIARTIFRLLTAVVLIYMAQYLSTEEYGMYSTALAWSNVFLALNDLGMSTLIVRESARNPKLLPVYFGNTLFVETILSIFFFFVTIGIGKFLHYDHTTILMIALLTAAGLIFEFRKVVRGIFRVRMELKLVAVMEVVNGLLYLGATLGIIHFITNTHTGLLALGHTRLWTNVLVIVILFIIILRNIKPKFASKQLWPMIKQSYLFTLYNMFFMLYFQIDQIIISIIKGESAVGTYSASANIVIFFLFIPIMLFQVIMPLMYRLSRNNIERYKRINLTIWRYLSAFGVPAGIGISLLASEIILLVYPDRYAASIPLLTVMGIFYSIRMLGISQGNSMTTTDRQGMRALIQILSVGVNIILDIILVTKFGALGATISTLITESIICASYLIFSAHHLKESLITNFASIAPIFFATAGMGLFIHFIHEHAALWLIIPSAIILYVFLLWAFRFFRPLDKKIILQIISRKELAK